MIASLLIPVLALSAGAYFLFSRKETRLSGGRFLDDIIPALDSFLADFPQLFPAGSYAVAPGALPPDSEGIRAGSIAFCGEAEERWISLAGCEELRTYFFRDKAAFDTMLGFTLGVAEELGAPDSGVSFLRQEQRKLRTVGNGEVRTIADGFKREYGLL